MNTLKAFILSKYKILSLVSITLVFSVIILMIRMKINRSFFYLFLVWNIFLAVIPYTITVYLSTKNNLNRVKLTFGFLIWLLFLPNAPYIITDLIHLKVSNDHLLWLDVLVVLSFALSGLLLFYLSLLDMQRLMTKQFNKMLVQPITLAVLFLSAFGVYLGRFLRYNSWEILSQPQNLISDIIHIIIAPHRHYDAWLFTIIFGVFLATGFWIFKNLTYQKSVTDLTL